MTKWSVPERYCKLTLYKGRKDLKEDNTLAFLTKNAKISFNTSETVSGAINETNINISGLKLESMLHLATSFNQWSKNTIRNQIILDAGYGSLHSVIFDGEIIEAIPNLESADYSVQCKCMSYYSTMMNVNFSLTFKGTVYASEIAKAIADKNSFLFINSIFKDIEVTDYNYIDKNPIQHAKNLAKISGLDIWIAGNTLYAKNVGMPLAKIRGLTITPENMIGSPQPTPLGCNVRIKLNPSVRTGQSVKLKSLKFPQLNSEEYVLQTFSHAGDTKGSKWETELKLVREDLYEK